MGSKDPQDLVAELRQRPTFAKASNDYLQMLYAMRAAISKAAPSVVWKVGASQAGQSLCAAPYTQVPGAIEGGFTSGGAHGGVPDAAWPALRQELIDLAAKQGFTKVVSALDKPGDHSVVMYDKWGGSVEFGSKEGTTVDVFAPCLLHENS